MRGTLKSARREAAKSRRSRSVTRCAFAQHDGRGHLFAELVVRHGKGERLPHGRVVHQHVVHLARRDLLAAAIDDLLQPPGDGEIAVLVEHALVAGAEPAIGEGFGIGLGVVLVAQR